MSLKLSHVRLFITVVEARSIHRGALALGISQPAVSAVIRELEATSGGRLLTRSSKGVALTDLGAVLLQRGRALIADVARLNAELASLQGSVLGTVSISVSPIMAGVFVPLAVDRFRRQMPNVEVHISEISGHKAFIQGLRQGEFDFAVAQTPDYFFPLPEDIERLMSIELPVLIGCRAQHPLAQATSLAELDGADWLLPIDDERARRAFADGFAHFGLNMSTNSIQCGSSAASLGILESMDYLAFFTRQLADETFERYGLVQIPIRERLPPLKAGIYQRALHDQTAAAVHLAECFRVCMEA